MEYDHPDITIESENADKTISDLFSGKLSIEQALQKLRTRLLDLSSRNRLLNYRHPKGRSIQFVDKPNLNLVFNRLIDGKAILIKYVPDPPTNSYTTKRPDARTYASSLGIDIEFEFEPSSCGTTANRHTPKLQALNYPADLDKLCRKVSSEARTIIEETGTNMLYLIFGFLEFYEREDSEIPMLAPLLSIPVSLEKGAIDTNTRTYQYSIVYSGEDISENQTLREKLSQDFVLQLPIFDEEDDPGSYFAKIQQSVNNKKRWKVKYQLTLGFISFGKLAIWNDLDPKKWPGLLNHPLLKDIFSGSSTKGSSLFPEDYDIDKHPQGNLPLIYDADSSQHSAIIDVLSGKNIVINGPPGTGKSQTITNIIATGLKDGKKILFVSEKLAALEVVRRRLNQANLGDFCLELHSHKTQKKKLLEDIQKRLDSRFQLPRQLQGKQSTLQTHKKELNRYAELMASQIGNPLGLTIYEIFWRSERWRNLIADLSNVVQSNYLSNAANWSYDDIELRRAKLEALGQLYTTIGNYDFSHPWWGFTPSPLAPGDDETISKIVFEARKLSKQLLDCVNEYRIKISDESEPTLTGLSNIYNTISKFPVPPDNLCSEILPRIYSTEDPLGKKSRAVIINIIQKVELAKELSKKADNLLVSDCKFNYDTSWTSVNVCKKELAGVARLATLDNLAGFVSTADGVIRQFKKIVSLCNYAFKPGQSKILESIESKLRTCHPLSLKDQSSQRIQSGASLLLKEIARLEQSLERVTNIANRRGIEFDSSPAAIANLGNTDGIKGVLPGVSIDDTVIQKSKQAAGYILSDLPIVELNKRQQRLIKLYDSICRVLDELQDYAKQLGLQFNGSQKSLTQLAVLSQIASESPTDLLQYRHPSIGNPKTLELITAAEKSQANDKAQRQTLASEFFLDALPSVDTLKAAAHTFRRGDSLSNLANSEWRAAKKLFYSICRTRKKRKASDYESQILNIISWIEKRALYVNNQAYKEAFGPLFKGISTDFAKIKRLHSWYINSQTIMLNQAGLIDAVDLTKLESRKISQLSALKNRIQSIQTELLACEAEVKNLVGNVTSQLELVLQQQGWTSYNLKYHQIAERIREIVIYLSHYVQNDISPKRAVDILCAKIEIYNAKEDFEALSRGTIAIHTNVEPLLPVFLQSHVLTGKIILMNLTCWQRTVMI